MDTYSRNAILVLFGSAMLLGLGLLGFLGTELDDTPGFGRLMSGWAPLWLAASGAVGISAVLVTLLKGMPTAGSPEKKDAEAEGESAKKETDEGAEEGEAGHLLADATLALVELEVLIRGEGGLATPPLGVAVPPAALCRALRETEGRWMASGLRKALHDELGAGKAAWKEAEARLAGTVPVRGRSDGEAASYRFGALVHVPPTATLDSTASVLELLGMLPGDRFIEVTMVRVPEEADTFAAAMTVAGGLAVKDLSGSEESA